MKLPYIDPVAIIADLNQAGWPDQKIEIACGFSGGYIAHLRNGSVLQISHQKAVRLHNFWVDQTDNAPKSPEAVELDALRRAVIDLADKFRG